MMDPKINQKPSVMSYELNCHLTPVLRTVPAAKLLKEYGVNEVLTPDNVGHVE